MLRTQLSPPPPPDSNVEALIPIVMIFKEEAFGSKVGLEEIMKWDPHDRISALVRRDTKGLACFPFFCHVRAQARKSSHQR